MDVNGSRVLVVGGSGVLGGLIGEELVRRGASVALAGRRGDRLDERRGAFPPSTPMLAIDLTDLTAPSAVVRWAVDQLGGLDGVVNAAGVVAFGPLQETDPVAISEVLTVDLIAPLTVVAEAVPYMDGGFVVNITGVVAERPVLGMTPYVAAKAGLSAATQALARELRRQGFLVVDARPPHTETGLSDRAIAGTAPRFPAGLDPAQVARRIVDAVVADEREVPAAAFA